MAKWSKKCCWIRFYDSQDIGHRHKSTIKVWIWYGWSQDLQGIISVSGSTCYHLEKTHLMGRMITQFMGRRVHLILIMDVLYFFFRWWARIDILIYSLMQNLSMLGSIDILIYSLMQNLSMLGSTDILIYLLMQNLSMLRSIDIWMYSIM